MQGATRTLTAVCLGFAVGLCVGPVSLLAINARYVLRGSEDWPEWSAEYRLALLLTSVPAAVNGAVGAGVALWRGRLSRRPVTVLPAALHVVVGLAVLVTEPQSFLGFQWYTLAFTAVMWSAGRLGLRLGCRPRPHRRQCRQSHPWPRYLGTCGV